jgi:hypothetical protein
MPDEAISKPPEHENIKEKPQEQPGRNPWGFRIRLFFALVLPIFMETLDYTIVATAQPHIAVSIPTKHQNQTDIRISRVSEL